MAAISGNPDPDAALEAKYPRLKHPAHVACWLGWVAYRMGAARSFARWQIASWVPSVYLAVVRWTVIACLAVPLCVVSMRTTPEAVVFLIFGGPRVLIALASKPGAPWEMPKALEDRRPELPWWRPIGDAVRRLLRIALTVILPGYLRGIWGVSPASEAPLDRRAQRRNDLLYVTVWFLGSAEVPLLLTLGGEVDRLSTALWQLVPAAGIVAFLTRRSLTDSAFAEVVLTVQWRMVPRFRRTLAEAVQHGVLRRWDDGFEFGDAGLRSLLSDAHSVALDQRRHIKDEQAARSGRRADTAKFLTQTHVTRVASDIGLGVVVGLSALVPTLGAGWGALILIPLTIIPGLAAIGVSIAVLRGTENAARWSLANVAITSRRTRACAALAAIGIGVLLALEFHGTSIALLTATLPAICTASCALWLTDLAVGRRRRSKRAHWRLAPDFGVITGTAITAVALLRRGSVTATPAAVLLFPIAVWLCIKAWRELRKSEPDHEHEHFLRKASADIVLAVLLGGVLVLFLVWSANVFDISRPEFHDLRDGFVEVDGWVNRPWWNWAVVFLFLCALTVAFAAKPVRMARVRKIADRVKITVWIPLLERVLNVTHIALMAVVLSAATVPYTMASIHGRQLKAAYTLALQRKLDTEVDLAAFEEIRADSTAQHGFPVLRALVLKVHELDPPPPGQDRATAVEQEVSHRLGHNQAVATAADLGFSATADPPPPAHTDVPVSGDLERRLEAVNAEEHEKKDREEQAEAAGKSAAAALAQSLSIPNLGGNEVLQIVQAYLSGLVEDSPVIKDVFARRFDRLAARSAPTSDDDLLDPVPEHLLESTGQDLSNEYDADGYVNPLVGLGPADPALEATRLEPPLDAAVDEANHARFLHDGGHGPCVGCTHPKSLTQEHGFGEHGTGGTDEHPRPIP